MFDIEKLDTINLENEKMRKEFLESAERVIYWYDIPTAYEYLQFLQSRFKGVKVIPNEIEGVIIKLHWLLFSNLSETEALNFFENNLDIGLQGNFEILYDLKVLLTKLFFDDQEQMKEKISGILDRNQAQVTKNPITIGEALNQKPTIQNWVLDYRDKVVNRPDTERTLARSEYFGLNKNFLKLDTVEKESIKKLFDIYDFVNTSSILPEGYPDDIFIKWQDGEMSLLDDGRLFSLYVSPRDERSTTPRANMQAQEVYSVYLGDLEPQKKITQEELRFQKKDTTLLRLEFFTSVQKKNVFASVALLRLLAHRGDIGKLLDEDQKLKKYLSTVWEKKGGKALSEEFQKQPSLPKFVKMFLQYVLEERLGLSSSDAARVGAQIGNLYKKAGKPEYSQMAYFDAQTKEFRWFDS